MFDIDSVYFVYCVIYWNYVTKCKTVDMAYDNFIDLFRMKINKICPLTKVKIINKKDKKPWITWTLKNCIRKKNKLYQLFIINRCNKSESRYKKYKNKLTSALRLAEKLYYQTQLENKRNYIKGTWSILNKVINNNKSINRNHIVSLNTNGTEITDNQQLCQQFNTLFTHLNCVLW